MRPGNVRGASESIEGLQSQYTRALRRFFIPKPSQDHLQERSLNRYGSTLRLLADLSLPRLLRRCSYRSQIIEHCLDEIIFDRHRQLAWSQFAIVLIEWLSDCLFGRITIEVAQPQHVIEKRGNASLKAIEFTESVFAQ